MHDSLLKDTPDIEDKLLNDGHEWEAFVQLVDTHEKRTLHLSVKGAASYDILSNFTVFFATALSKEVGWDARFDNQFTVAGNAKAVQILQQMQH